MGLGWNICSPIAMDCSRGASCSQQSDHVGCPGSGAELSPQSGSRCRMTLQILLQAAWEEAIGEASATGDRAVARRPRIRRARVRSRVGWP